MNNTTKTMSDNRKALPKFFMILVISMVIGFFCGLATGFFSGTLAPDRLVQKSHEVLAAIAPYAIWIGTIVLCSMAAFQHKQAIKLFNAWDEEDEETINQAEMKINWSILLTNLSLILNFFFYAVLMILLDNFSILGISGFIISLAVVIILQQKNVDLTRKMNPEKQGSVYDPKFQKKWVESCDENEIRQIGQASFKAFTVTNYTCIGLWLVIIMVSPVIQAGIFPAVIVTIIMAVLQITFILESIRISK